MKKQLTQFAVLAGLMAAPGLVQAQHYPTGAEGIRGASLPPPGVYLRDYNIGYYADRYPDGPPGFDVGAYINAPRLIWMTEYKIFGANYGWDVIVPFGYQHISFAEFDHKSFGLADIQIEPLLLAWHLPQIDISAGLAVWAPTGEFDVTRPDHLGKGYWGQMTTLGATFFFDKEKTWALSALNRYEFNFEQDDTHITPGQVYTIEWGASKTFNKTLDVGLIGYWQQQTSSSDGANAPKDKPGVVGIGPEVAAFFPKQMLGVSLRYAYEFSANDRPQGHTFCLTLTKRF